MLYSYLPVRGAIVIHEQAVDALLVVAVKQRGGEAVLIVDDVDPPERQRIGRSGDPVRVENKLVGHFDVRAQQRKSPARGLRDPCVDPAAAQLDVAVVRAELLIQDLLIVDRSGYDQIVGGREPRHRLDDTDPDGGTVVK